MLGVPAVVGFVGAVAENAQHVPKLLDTLGDDSGEVGAFLVSHALTGSYSQRFV